MRGLALLLVVPTALFAVRQTPTPVRPLAGAEQVRLAANATELTIRSGLVLAPLGSYGRSAVPTDLLAWQLATGAFREPREGDVVGPDESKRTQTWTRLEAGADGWMQNRALNGGYFWVAVNSDRPRTMVLDASGYYVVRVNGEPRGGEKYGTDWVRHPIHLRAGRNTMLFQGERGRLRARLFDPPAPVFFTDSDATLPDLIVGEAGTRWAGVRLVNTTEETLDRIEVSYTIAGRTGTVAVPVSVPPLMTRKLAVPVSPAPAEAEGTATLALTATARAGRRTTTTPACELKTVAATAHHVRTFVSEIDGSVQYYAVAPLAGSSPAAAGTRPALVLSLHGAGVEAVNQARAYKPKDWAWIVAPSNRRPYGFDWEDWGRLDALEVLEDAARRFNTDPARTYLTGHSMGGHGTWQIGATAPDLWAAIAPSAGWHSFSSYGGGPAYKDPTPVETMLVRANHPGETPALARNMLHYGVYVLHGDKDDNVPVAQARFMREVLGKFHPDFSYYERPGAGHWWGDECVDWPPLFEFLKRHVRVDDADANHVEFVTADPGISATSKWVTIVEQQHPREYSRVTIDRDPKAATFKGSTENVAHLALARPSDAKPWTAEIDGTRLSIDAGKSGALHFERGAAGWHIASSPDPARKHPQRAGGFKDAFRHHVVLVYGTLGTAAENARSFNKARFDAESFWYRGNGSLDVVADRAFDPAKEPDRNVVLYGNADTNAAWKALLGNAPVEIRNGRARIGDREFAGSDLGAYFVRPRPGSRIASVGAVAWTGAAGWLAANPVQYFISGAGFPDLLLFSTDMLRRGTRGIQAIGWFGNDWSVEHGEFEWTSRAGSS